MSLHMNTGQARLTVIGTGWDNTAVDSGNGFTIDGLLWEDVAWELNYDFGGEIDWDLIAANESPQIDWTEVIYTDTEDNVYTDYDGDGIWTDPLTGIEYPGGGDMWIPEDMLIGMSDTLSDLVVSDSTLAQYSIPNEVIHTLYGGKVTTEINYSQTDPARPHYYAPPVWYIQDNSDSGVIFLDEPFFHGTADGGSITVYDEAVTIRDGSSKEVYWSNCTTQFSTNYLPSPYNSYPIQYVCWQCLYGSLDDALLTTNPDTITTDEIRNGESGLTTMVYNNKTYYLVES
jgi:hypothetical protein